MCCARIFHASIFFPYFTVAAGFGFDSSAYLVPSVTHRRIRLGRVIVFVPPSNYAGPMDFMDFSFGGKGVRGRAGNRLFELPKGFSRPTPPILGWLGAKGAILIHGAGVFFLLPDFFSPAGMVAFFASSRLPPFLPPRGKKKERGKICIKRGGP